MVAAGTTGAVAILAVAGITDAEGMVLADTSVVAPPTAGEARHSQVEADTMAALAVDTAAVMAGSAEVAVDFVAVVVVVDSAAVAAATAAAAHTAADTGNSA